MERLDGGHRSSMADGVASTGCQALQESVPVILEHRCSHLSEMVDWSSHSMPMSLMRL